MSLCLVRLCIQYCWVGLVVFKTARYVHFGLLLDCVRAATLKLGQSRAYSLYFYDNNWISKYQKYTRKGTIPCIRFALLMAMCTELIRAVWNANVDFEVRIYTSNRNVVELFIIRRRISLTGNPNRITSKFLLVDPAGYAGSKTNRDAPR